MPTIRTRAAKGSALTHNEVDANFSRTVTQKTTTYTCTAADNRSIIEGSHATTPFTITLPTVATAAAAEPGDYRVTITNINAAVVSVDGNGVETINGSTDTITLKQWDSVTCVLNSAGTAWVAIQRTGDLGPIDGTTATFSGDVTGATIIPTGDTTASDAAAVGYTAAEGLILTGQGSTNDVTIKNDADADVLTIATGTTSVDVVGDLTAATVNADGDTSAGDGAAMGYTATEGLILTGQGSTNDITIKNDADADVLVVPTGTNNVTIEGNAVIGGAKTTTEALLQVGDATLTTGNAALELGKLRSGDGAAYIDFGADSVTYTDYALRCIRNSGTNGTGQIIHRGTGSFSVITDEAASIVLQTNSTTAATFDTSQNLDVVGDVTAATVNADGDTAAGDNAAMGYTATEGLILTGQGSANDITLKNDADAAVATVPTGTTTFKLDGGQLAFPATQNASTDVNTLDDYEEGTFTPTIQDTSASDAEGQTYSTNTGYYTKVGNVVHIWGEVNLTSYGTLTTSAQTRVANLPFTAANNTSGRGGLMISYAAATGAFTAGQGPHGEIVPNTNYALLYKWSGSAASPAQGYLISDLGTGGQIYFSATYMV